MEKYLNRLVSSVNYYSCCSCSTIMIGRYITEKSLMRESIDLYAIELATAFGCHLFNGLIIDAFMFYLITSGRKYQLFQLMTRFQ